MEIPFVIDVTPRGFRARAGQAVTSPRPCPERGEGASPTNLGGMRRDLAWLAGIIVVIALAARFLEPHGQHAPPVTASPSAADVERARGLLHPPSLSARESQQRLVLYNAIRDEMDASRFGVLEAVAAELRAAPGNRVSLGYDLRTFYSAVGGDLDFRGGGQEDWPRLLAFQQTWLDAIPKSTAAHVARAQTRVTAPATPTALSDALVDLRAAGNPDANAPADPYQKVVLGRLVRDSQARQDEVVRAAAQALLESSR